jgi:hypothetical protein
MSRLTILNPDDGTFRFAFMNPTTFKKSASEEMRSNMSAGEISNSIKSYYNEVGVNPVVTKINYDVEDNETDDAEAIVKSVFEIKIDRLITGITTDGVTVARATTKSELTFEHNVVVSGPPISGKYKVKCVYANGKFTTTKAMAWNTSAANIGRAISE